MKNNRNIRQKGAVLMTLIVAIVVIALSGSAMLYFSTTSTFGELFTNRQERAYYIGESGINYALQRYLADKTHLFPISAPAIKTLSSGDQFSVTSEIVYKGSPAEAWLVIKSTGIAGTGWLTTRQLVTKEIKEALAMPPGMAPPTTDASGDPIGFDENTTAQPGGFNPLDDSWSIVDSDYTDAITISDTGDLSFKGTQAMINLNPLNVNLCDEWTNNGNYLSYILQAKITNSSNAQHFLVGISFRVKDNSETSDSYGFSLFRYDTTNCNRVWCNNENGIQRVLTADRKVYAVLWKRISNVYTVLAYTEMVDSFNIVEKDNKGNLTGQIKPWPTLVVRINERVGGNYMKAYIKSPTDPATGYVDWNISNFVPITWTYTQSPCSSIPCTEVVDNTARFRTSGFCVGTTQNWPEVGIHGFYDTNCDDCQLFDDFGASVLGTAGGGSQY